MRLTLLVCLLATAATASYMMPHSSFQQGRTYDYRFRTQVSHSLLTDLPNAIREQAVTALQANLKLTFTNDRHARVQLQQVRLGEHNGPMEQGQEKMIPTEALEKRDMPQEMKEKLALPFSVNLVDGVVERVQFHEDDSVWSKNIKRATLNLIQLNLKRNDVQGLKLESSQPQIRDEQDKEHKPIVFTIPEITLEGECMTTYTVQESSNRYEEQQQQFNVTKNVNFNQCRKVSDVNYGIQVNADQQLRCLKCIREADMKPKAVGKTEKQEQLKLTVCQEECQTNQLSHQKDIERSTVGRFELQGSREKYSLRRSQIISQYVVKAQNPQAQNTVSQVVAISELTLKQQESEEQVPETKLSSKEETLLYSPEWDLAEKRFFMWGDEQFDHKNSPFARVQQKAHKAGSIIRQILKQWNEDRETGYELNTAMIFNQLVQVVRQSTLPELQEIEQQVGQIQGSNQQSEHAKSVFLDALAVAATRNTLKVLENKIKQREVSTIKAAQLVKIFLANQHSPSDRQVDLLEKIATSEPAKQCPVLRQASWLAYGAAIGKICQEKPAESQRDHFRVEELCPESKKDTYTKTMMLNWMQASTVYDHILVLKVIGNAAIEETLPELQKIIVDKRQPVLIRMEAIDALRRLRTTQAQKIQQILLPVFQNMREQPEIRMAAVSMLLYTQPPQVILDQIVFSVQNDRSQNVKTFVLTAMESLSRSPVSGEQHIAKHLKAALKFVKLTPDQMRNSRKYRVPIYVSEQQDTEEQNLFLGLASIISPSNMLPVHLAASLKSAFNGDATQEKLQLSFSQKDLEQLYEKLYNAYGRSYQGNDEKSQERQSAKDLRQIYSTLGIKSRRSGSYLLSSEENEESSEQLKRSSKVGPDSPFAMIVLRSNDVDQVIIPVEEQKLPQMIRKFLDGESLELSSELRSELASGKHFQQHIALTVGETKTKLPTSAGLPLEITWQTSAVASIQGKLQGEIQFSRSKVQGQLKLRTSAIATHMHKTETWTPAMISGVQTSRTIELNHNEVTLNVEATNGKVEMTLNLPKQEQKERVLGLHTLPATFIQKFDWETRTPKEPRIRVVRNLAIEHTQREYHESNEFGAIRVEGQFHKVPLTLKDGLDALYSTENNVHIYYKPTESTPTELSVRVSGFSFRRSESGHKKPEFDDFYHGKSSKRQSFRSIYDDEEESEYKGMQLNGDNTQRHSRLSSFVSKYQPNKAYQHQLKVEIKARAQKMTHEAEIQVQGQCDQHMQHCKATFNAQRTPFFSNERENWSIQGQIQTVAPEQARNDEETEKKHSRMLVQAEAEWGPSGSQNQEIHIRVQAEPTRKDYWQSESAQKWSKFLNKIDLVAEYKLHAGQRHFVERIFNLGKYQYYWQLTSDGERKGEPGMIRASMVVDPITRRYVNITVQTPEERVQGKMLELPIRVQPFALERRSQQYHSFSQLVQSYSQQNAECRVDDRRIRTFDGVTYKAPLSSCWSVLAKDCSRENPRFVVLMKKSESEESKKIKIITPESTIELQKKSGSHPIVVKIDGEQTSDEERLQEQGIERSEYQVFVQKRGISVRFDGEEASIKVGGMYKNIQCGLCGHYTNEEDDVFRTSDNKRSQNLKEFHKSYILTNEECGEQKLKKFYQDNDSSEFQIKQKKPKSSYFRENFHAQDEQDSSEERDGQWWTSSEENKENSGKTKPIDQTQTLEYAQKLCFSVKPIKSCPRGTVPDKEIEPKEVKVQFFCLDRHSSQARRLQRQVRQGKIVDSSGFQPSFYDDVEQPVKCVEAEYY